jgi:hypothetical protein
MEEVAAKGYLTSKGVIENRATKINKLHDGILKALRKSVDQAIEIGELLTDQKATLAHGEWLPWLTANIKFAERTAQEYMGFYEHRDRLKSARCADFASARKLLKEFRKPRTPEPITEPTRDVEVEPVSAPTIYLPDAPMLDPKARELVTALGEAQAKQSFKELVIREFKKFVKSFPDVKQEIVTAAIEDYMQERKARKASVTFGDN